VEVVGSDELPVFHPRVISGLYQRDLDMGPCIGEVSDANPRFVQRSSSSQRARTSDSEPWSDTPTISPPLSVTEFGR